MENLSLAEFLKHSSLEKVLETSKIVSKKLGLTWTTGIAELIKCLRDNTELIPGKIVGVSLEDTLTIWLRKYQKGLNSRFKEKAVKPSGIKRDPILKHVLKIANPNLPEQDIENILKSHTLVMAIENNIGGLLEDYIAYNLEPKGWISAWGSTLKAVDFYEPKEDKLLQVKNRSNSENSSSMAIRKGTNIQKWDRINAQNGKTNWEKLEAITGVSGMSEKKFFDFVGRAVTDNPKLFCL